MKKNLFQQAALSFLNIPYIWGGDDPIIGFDCSGLVQELISIVGLDPSGDQTAQGLFEHFKSRSKQYSTVTPVGALAFYGSNTKNISHVAMIIDESGIMIEAGGGGSSTVNSSAAAKQNAYVRLRPFNRRSDLVAVLLPNGMIFD